MKFLLIPAFALQGGLAALLAQAAGDPLAIQALKEIGSFIVSLVTAVGVILVSLQAKKTQQEVKITQEEMKANAAVTLRQVAATKQEAQETRQEIKHELQETRDEVKVNTQLTKVVGREAQEAHREAQAAVVHANAVNEKIASLAERQLQLVIPDDEEFIMLLTRCIASAREVQEERRRAREGQ